MSEVPPVNELYSKNLLKNPSAEEGLTGWVFNNVNVVDGGTDGTKCFQLSSIANMSQASSFPIQPPDFQVEVDFLPEVEPADDDPDVKAVMKVVLEYADGSRDTFLFPCRKDVLGEV